MTRNNVVVQGGKSGVFGTFYYIGNGLVEVQFNGKDRRRFDVKVLGIGKAEGVQFMRGNTLFRIYRETETRIRIQRMNGRMKLQQREGTLPPGFETSVW